MIKNSMNGFIHRTYVKSIPGMAESIREAREAPASERLEGIGWDIN